MVEPAVRRLALLGGESSGKTTLARAAAAGRGWIVCDTTPLTTLQDGCRRGDVFRRAQHAWALGAQGAPSPLSSAPAG